MALCRLAPVWVSGYVFICEAEFQKEFTFVVRNEMPKWRQTAVSSCVNNLDVQYNSEICFQNIFLFLRQLSHFL